MGNQIVIPASKDWWSSVLNSKDYIVKEQVQSGSLFLKFICSSKSEKTNVFVKAYQSEHLSRIPRYKEIKQYFEVISKIDVPLINYYDMIETSNSVFFIRRKFGQPLSDVIMQEPILYNEEKLWIMCQLFSSIDSIHKLNIYHGDLKPSNILYVPSGRVYIVDPAPFKPFVLDQYHPHYFYYFFATDSSSGCFLAPERLVGASGDNFSVSDLILADLFSLGCIVAFMYLNGEPLFSADTARKYAKGEFKGELEAALAPIQDKNIVNLIKGLISLNPRKRRETFESFLERGFPNGIKEATERFFPKKDYIILNQKSISKIFDFDQLTATQPQKEFPEVIARNSLLPKEGGKKSIGMRVNFFNYFGYRGLKAKSLKDLNFIIDFIMEFTLDFDNEAKLMRLVPLLIQFFDIPVFSLRRKISMSIINVFQSISQIPNDMKGIIADHILPLFRRKFRKEGINLKMIDGYDSEIDLASLEINRNEVVDFSEENQSNSARNSKNMENFTEIESFLLLIAEFFPFFAFEVLRLQPKIFSHTIFAFNFLKESSLDTFKIFGNSLKKVAEKGSYDFFSGFLPMLNNFFSYEEIDYKIEYVRILISIYSNADSKEKQYFANELMEILPKIFDAICPGSSMNFFERKDVSNVDNNSINKTMGLVSKSRPGLPIQWDGVEYIKMEDLTCISLQFFNLLLANDFLDPLFTYSISCIMVPLMNSKSDRIISLLSILRRYFTPFANQMPLFIFIKDRLDTYSGFTKDEAKYNNIIKLQEQQRNNNNSVFERIKFADPLLSVPLVRKFKRVPFSPHFIESQKKETQSVSNISIDNELCVYTLNRKKLRYFKNSFFNADVFSGDKEINDINYDKSITRHHEGHIASIELLGGRENCNFSNHLVVAYERGRIDCIDLTKEYAVYSYPLANQSRHLTMKVKQNSEANISTKYRNQTFIDPSRMQNISTKDKLFRTIQTNYTSKDDYLTSFCTLKKRNCLVSGQWNGCIEILDVRASPTKNADKGLFGFIGGGGSVCIPFKFESLVTLTPSPVNDDYLYAGFSTGMSILIDLRVGIPVYETLSIPASSIWPVCCDDGLKSSCIAVYDGESTIQFISEPNNSIVKTVNCKNGLVGTTFNGGVVVADEFSAAFLDISSDDDNFKLFDGAISKLNIDSTDKNRYISSPDLNNDLILTDIDISNFDTMDQLNQISNSSNISSLSCELEIETDDLIENQIKTSAVSLHMHKSPLNCISKFQNLFATGDSTGFVNLWSICSIENCSSIPSFT